MEKDKTAAREFALPPLTMSVQKNLSGECVYAESSGDFILPDYLPEIRKVLRVVSRVLPAGRYIGTKTAEFAGSVAHLLVYAGADGELIGTNLTSDYEFNVQMGADAMEGDPAVSAECETDNVVVRLSGPRRLTIKTRIRALPSVYITRSLAEKLEGRENAEDEFAIERLTTAAEAAYTLNGESGDFEVSDMLTIEGDSAPAYCECGVHITEARAVEGGMTVRGEVHIKCVCAPTGESEKTPYCVNRKIPFEKMIDIEGMTPAFSVRASGRCVSIEGEMSDSGYIVTATVAVDGEGSVNNPLTLTSDVYSTANECRCKKTHIDLSRLIKCANFSASVSGSFESEEEAAALVDIGGEAVVGNVKITPEKTTVDGEIKLTAILSPKGDGATAFTAAEGSIPFRVESEGAPAPADCEIFCTAEVSNVRGRLDGGKITVDAEVGVSLRATEKRSADAVEVATIDKTVTVDTPASAMVIYYPDEADTLWSVAKKYHVSCKTLAETNKLDEESLKLSGSPASLDGVTALIVV